MRRLTRRTLLKSAGSGSGIRGSGTHEGNSRWSSTFSSEPPKQVIFPFLAARGWAVAQIQSSEIRTARQPPIYGCESCRSRVQIPPGPLFQAHGQCTFSNCVDALRTRGERYRRPRDPRLSSMHGCRHKDPSATESPDRLARLRTVLQALLYWIRLSL